MSSDSFHPLVLSLLKSAFEQLGSDVPPARQAALADMITRTMGQPGRVFHAVHHALALADETLPVITLAALFHDLVYLKLDDGFPQDFRSIAERLFLSEEHGFLWQAHAASPLENMCAALFDVQSASLLRPERGLNEFSSALLAVNALGDLIPQFTLLSVLTCIEASIPFRTRKDRNLDQEEFHRLQLVSAQFDCALGEQDINTAVAFAREFANRDVMGFAISEPALFLTDTLALVEENARVAIRHGSDMLEAYLRALVAMQRFLDGLAPEAVFRGEDCTVEKLRDVHLLTNLHMGRLALRLMIIACASLQGGAGVPMVSQTQASLPLSMQGLAELLKNVSADCRILCTLVLQAQFELGYLCDPSSRRTNHLAHSFFDGHIDAELYLAGAIA